MKLRAILPNSPEVLHEIASIHEEIGDVDQAVDWYAMLLSVVPTDPNVLSRLGDIFDRQDDKSKAFQYHTDVCLEDGYLRRRCTFFPSFLFFLSF